MAAKGFKRYVYHEGLTNLVGSKGKYLINVKGQIKDIEGNDVPITRDEEGHKVVKCLSWDGYREYRTIDLVVLQYKGLQIPTEDYDKVIAFCADNDPNNTHASNVGYRFKSGKLEHKAYEGYYYIPGFPKTVINIEGNAINSITGHVHTLYTSRPIPDRNITGGYKYYSVTFTKGVPCFLLRHRALCLVFKEYPNNVDELDVNHIDGIPGNDWLSNLEWMSRSDNNKHAVKEGLRTQNLPIVVRDLTTKEIVTYSSMTEYARVCGRNVETISLWVTRRSFGETFRIPNGKIQIKLASDPRPFPDVDNRILVQERLASSRQVAINARNLLTGETTIYPDFYVAYKIHGQNIVRHLEAGRQPVLMTGWQLKQEDQEWEEHEDIDKLFYQMQEEVMWKDTRTGQVGISESSRAVARDLGWPEDLRKYIRLAALTRGNKIYRHHRFRLGVTDEPWPDEVEYQEYRKAA